MKDLFRVRSISDVYWLGERVRRFGPRTVLARNGMIEFTNAVIHTPYAVGPYEKKAWNKDWIMRETTQAREAFASMIGAEPSNVLLESNTTAALRNVLRFLRVNRPDLRTILTTGSEYESMTRTIADIYQDFETSDVHALEHTISESDADIVFFSHVLHDGRQVLPVQQLTAAAHKKGKYVIVDAAQSVGQFPVSVKELGCDALVGCGHKWLAGETISGFAYMRDGFDVDYRPIGTAYTYPDTLDMELLDYDGPVAIDGLSHVHRAIAMRHNWKDDFARIAELGTYGREVVKRNPHLQLMGTESPPPGMVAFTSDIPDLQRRLEEDSIMIAEKGPEQYRISFMPLNLPREIDTLDRAVRRLAA